MRTKHRWRRASRRFALSGPLTILALAGLIPCSAASAERPALPPPPKPPLGTWTVTPSRHGFAAGGFTTHLSGKNLVATGITFTLDARPNPPGEVSQVCPFLQTTTMEVVGPLLVPRRQMSGRYYRNEVTFWANDNHRAEIRTEGGTIYHGKVGIFFPGNWGANPIRKGEKLPGPGIQVEVAPRCLYLWTKVRAAG